MPAPAVRQFAGDIRFWEKQSNGSLTPVIVSTADPSGNQPLEVDSLVFGYEAGEEQSVVSKRRDSRYLQPIHAETLPGTTSVTVTSLEVPPIILARMLYGAATAAVVEAGSVTTANLLIPTDLTLPVQLPHRLLKASPGITVVTSADAPLAQGTDYEIDLRRGQLMVIANAGIAGGDTVKVSYEYPAYVDTTIVGGAVPTRSFFITGDMQDRISQENGELRIPQANLTTDGDVDWLSTEPIQVTLTGPCIVASGESAAYTFNTYKASA